MELIFEERHFNRPRRSACKPDCKPWGQRKASAIFIAKAFLYAFISSQLIFQDIKA